jgi:hypothetical protein
MNPDSIATATRCSCGQNVNLRHVRTSAWNASCPDCLDGAEDASATAHVQGEGTTPNDALWSWQDKHDAAHEVEWCLADLHGELARQVSEERFRQRGWGYSAHSATTAARRFGPEL